MKGFFLSVTILVSLWSRGLSAQERVSPLLRSGERVRVTVRASALRPEPWIGKFSAISNNNLTFITNDGTTHVFAFAAINRLEVDRGRSRTRSVLTGAGIGLAAAAVVAAVVPCQGGTISHCHLFGTIVLGVPATLTGAVVGFVRRGERWIDVSIR